MSDDIIAIARAVKDGKSRSYVEDAKTLAKAYLELYTNHASYCISPETYLALEARFRVAETELKRRRSRAALAVSSVSDLQQIDDALIAIQEPSNPPPVANYKAVLANLDDCQRRNTELVEENRILKTQPPAYGLACPNCKAVAELHFRGQRCLGCDCCHIF